MDVSVSDKDEVDFELLEERLCQTCLDTLADFYEDQINSGDEENNGVVLSSIYGREENRCYAKPVIAGKSQYVLSKEEQEVLQQK